MGRALDGLDATQLGAVTSDGGPLLVVGGPGTGKTHVLARRFAWLVEEGVSPGGLLALAFSRAGAAALREGIEATPVGAAGDLAVCTWEAFCDRLLHEEAQDAGLDPFFPIIDPADRLALLLERIDDLTLRRHEIRGSPAPLLAGLISKVDRLKQEAIGVEDYLAFAESLKRSATGEGPRARAARELEFARFYTDHDRLLAARGALDRGDLVLEAVRLLRENPDVRARVAERYTHVLVDELEDASFAQGELLRLLGGEHLGVTAAGDDDVGIGRFRGASRKSLEDFARAWPEASALKLKRGHRFGRRIAAAARAVAGGIEGRIEKSLSGGSAGQVRFWRCRSERAQAQGVAGEAERLIGLGRARPEDVAVLVRSVGEEGTVVAAALEERGVAFHVSGTAAYFQRSEVRDVLAWLRLLSDPADSGAVVRALSRPPIELRSVDIARLTQFARRRRLDMVSGVAAACESPHLSPEGRERAEEFLRLHRRASRAFEQMRPDEFVHRLIERIGLRRQQVFASHGETAERLVNIAKLSQLATAYMRREPSGTARSFARHVAAVAESGLPEEEATPAAAPPGVRIMAMDASKGLDFAHVFVLGLDAGRLPGTPRRGADAIPEALLKEDLPKAGAAAHEAEARRLLYVAMTRARSGLVLAWAESGDEGDGVAAGPSREPSPLYGEALEAAGVEEELLEEELFGPGEALHSTYTALRGELLDAVSGVGGRLREMRLDTYLDVSQAVARYLELIKLAALIERSRDGQPLSESLPEVNELLKQAASPEQRQLFEGSALDDYLREAGRTGGRRGTAPAARAEPSLESFIPRHGDGLMLSASDVELYRLCPLKYKFARVFRIPQEPTINQRFGILLHQVLERFHSTGGGSLEYLMHLFEAAWRRCGFGDSNDDLQFRERAVAALRSYWERDRKDDGEPEWVERSFSFKLGPHLVRGRVDRVDRLAAGGYELIDYKTGKPKAAAELSEDLQLSLYQMGARESWGVDPSAQSYYYVLTGEKVPVRHSEEDLERARESVDEIAAGILEQRFEPKPSYELCSFCDYRIVCPAAEK